MTAQEPLIVELIDTLDALRACRSELAELAAAPGTTSSIVQHPDWVAFEVASRGGKATPHVLVARDSGGAVRGYAPLLATALHARASVGKQHWAIYRSTGLRLLGESVVAAEADRESVLGAVTRTIAADRNVHALSIEETRLPSPFADALVRTRRGYASTAINLLEQTNWTLVPPPTLAEYLARLDGKRRKDLHRRVRNTYKQLGDTAKLRRFDTAESMPEYAHLLNSVYARSWHAASAPINWEQPDRLALFDKLAASQGVIGHLLMLGERPIAYVHGYRASGRYLLDNIGYDEEFAPLGIGLALVFEAIQDLLERFPGEVIDFGYGDNQYKRVLGNHSEPCGSLFLVRGLRARARLGLVRPLRLAYGAAHGVAKSGLLKKWLKRR